MTSRAIGARDHSSATCTELADRRRTEAAQRLDYRRRAVRVDPEQEAARRLRIEQQAESRIGRRRGVDDDAAPRSLVLGVKRAAQPAAEELDRARESRAGRPAASSRSSRSLAASRRGGRPDRSRSRRSPRRRRRRAGSIARQRCSASPIGGRPRATARAPAPACRRETPRRYRAPWSTPGPDPGEAGRDASGAARRPRTRPP